MCTAIGPTNPPPLGACTSRPYKPHFTGPQLTPDDAVAAVADLGECSDMRTRLYNRKRLPLPVKWWRRDRFV